MKQKILINALLICALTLSFAACSDIAPIDNNGDESGNGVRTEKLGVQLESGTKVTLSGEPAIFQWTEGDMIAVWKGTSATSGGYQNCEVSNHAINVSLAANESRFNYAVYPASASSSVSYGQNKLAVNLPSTYTYSQVCNDNTPLPMIAVNSNNNDKLTFYNVGALLRLTISGIPTEDGVYLKVDFNGKDVCGSFTVTNPSSTAPYIGPGSTGNYDKITITNLGGRSEVVINIPVPQGTYQDIIVSAWKSNNVPVKAQVLPFNTFIYRAHGRRMEVPLTLGVFSRASKKYSVFSTGNLRAYTQDYGEHWTWSFANNQYDYVGNNIANTKIASNAGRLDSQAEGYVDLFGWNGNSSDNNCYGISRRTSTPANAYGNVLGEKLKNDWGANTIGSYASNTWRTFSKDEWTYLFGSNRNVSNTLGDNYRYLYATIASTYKGLVIFPDNYVHPNDVTIGGTPTYNNKSDYSATISSTGDWLKMEAAGAVFLPAAGSRTTTIVYSSGAKGAYWSSNSVTSTNNDCAYFLSFDSGQAPTSAWTFRYCGHSVRLVRDIN